MPFSDQENKHVVKDWYNKIKPARVLDIGVGEGTYSKLLRTEDHKDKWCGVEAWAPYIDQFNLNEIYDEVLVADARLIDYKKLGQFDLAIAGDVLEHMKRHEAINLINELKKQSSNVIVSIPVLHLDQDSYEGNWFETHVDHWSYEDMAEQLQDGLAEGVKGETLGYFWWQG